MDNLHLIIGLGPTGYSCVRYLARARVPMVVMDNRPHPPMLAKLQDNFPDVKVHLGSFDVELLEQASTIVLSPGVPLSNPILASYQDKIIGDVELFARAVAKLHKSVVGITGSNGKTTVTTLMGDVLKVAGKKVAVCGNIGTPVLDALLDSDANIFVVELSSFQLETTYSLKTKTAVLLNLSPDHMDRHKTVDDYRKAKQRIYHGCKQAVVNFDEPELWQDLDLKKPISFSVKSDKADWSLKDLPIDELPLKGAHHFQNDLAVMAMGSALGLSKQVILKTLKSFFGLEHRCQLVRELSNIAWYNDSKGTNVGATKTALSSVGAQAKGRLIWIAGGQGKNADFTMLNNNIRDYVSHAVLLGEDAPFIERAISDLVPTVHVGSVEEAVKKAAELARPGDAVLFSPACASFDMFANFEERGKCFQKAVAALQK